MRIIPHSKPTLGIEERNAVAEVIRSGNIAQGEKVAEFEQAMAEYIGREYAVAVSSGFAALHLALLAASEKHVLIPSYSCKALYHAAQAANKLISLIDEKESISILRVDRPNHRYGSIVPHTFGFTNLNIIHCDDIPIIEDCATAMGGMHDGKMLGFFGKISVFSFYATKMITTGEGGMVLTDDIVIAEKIKQLRDYTINNDDTIESLRCQYDMPRFNYKMTDMAAAMGIVQMGRLPEFLVIRYNLSCFYDRLLRKREDIKTNLHYDGIIGNRPAYGVKQPLHRILKLDPKDFPDAEKLANEVISLPLYPSLSMEDVKYIVKNFFEVLAECE